MAETKLKKKKKKKKDKSSPSTTQPQQLPSAADWPPSLKALVSLWFSRCKDEGHKDVVQQLLTKEITAKAANNLMWCTDWAELDDHFPHHLLQKQEVVVVLRKRSCSEPPCPSRKLVVVAGEEMGVGGSGAAGRPLVVNRAVGAEHAVEEGVGVDRDTMEVDVGAGGRGKD